MANDGRPKCRTCGAPVGPGAGQEVSRWLDSRVRTYGTNERRRDKAAMMRAKNAKGGK